MQPTFRTDPVFHVSDIERADTEEHDFGDGNDAISGAYAPCLLRLEAPGHKGIGIHGTHLPDSIGSRATEDAGQLSLTN